MKCRKWFSLVFLVLWGLSLRGGASAALYRWVDKKGEVHYTDDLSKVPAGARWEERALSQLPSLPAPSARPPEAVNAPSPEGTREGGGAPAGGAPAESQALQKIMAGVQEKLRGKLQEKEKLEVELRRPKYKQMVRSERQLMKELERVNGEIEALKAEEQKIKEEAGRLQR